jgi:hypothetical protein
MLTRMKRKRSKVDGFIDGGMRWKKKKRGHGKNKEKPHCMKN